MASANSVGSATYYTSLYSANPFGRISQPTSPTPQAQVANPNDVSALSGLLTNAQNRTQAGVNFLQQTASVLQTGQNDLAQMQQITQQMGALAANDPNRAKLATEFNQLATNLGNTDNTEIGGIKVFTAQGQAQVQNANFNNNNGNLGRIGSNGEFASIQSTMTSAGVGTLSANATADQLTAMTKALNQVGQNLQSRQNTVGNELNVYNQTLNRLQGLDQITGAANNPINTLFAPANNLNAGSLINQLG